MLRFLLALRGVIQVVPPGFSIGGLTFLEISRSEKVVPIESERTKSNNVSVSPIGSVDADPQRNVFSRTSSKTSSVAESNTASKVQKKLEAATAASQKLRFRITLCTAVAGSVPLIVTMWMQYLLVFFTLDPYEFGYRGYYGGVIAWFGMLSFLGVMPNDLMLVRAMSLFLFNLMFSSVFLEIGVAANIYFRQPAVRTASVDGHTLHLCGENESKFVCGLYVARHLIGSLCFMMGSWSIWQTLARYENVKFYDKSKPKGHRFNDEAFKTPARTALDKMWLDLRLYLVSSVGSCVLVFAFALQLFTDDQFSKDNFAAELFLGITWNLCSALFTNERRRFIMAVLTRINMGGEANAAACVAALLGDSNAEESLQLAKQNFRSISFSSLEPDDLLKNREQDGSTNELYSRTTKARLGSCDAFLSHSWADDGRKKYRALRRWAIEFKIKNGREPEIWLDKACIDQNNIANDLLCLPIFTAGCNELLIVAGPTYVSRLWCIIEVFVFLKMGGDVDRITVIPIDMTEKSAKHMFEQIDASKSKCYKETDRQKLLGIVEQGFGNFDDFNEMLQHVFQKRATSGNVYGSMRRKTSTLKFQTDVTPTVSYELDSKRQIIVEPAPGTHSLRPILLDLECTTTVDEILVKTRIKIQESLQQTSQPNVVLFYNGMQLRRAYTLENYEVQNNESLQLVVRPSDEIEVNVESSLSDNLVVLLEQQKRFSFRMDSSQQVYDVKVAIHRATGVQLDNILLSFQDKPLSDGQFLFECGVKNQSTLHMITVHNSDFESRQPIQITINRFDRGLMKTNLNSDDAISVVKKQIEEITSMPVQHQRLFHVGETHATLLEDNKVLDEYNIRHGSTIYVLEQKVEVPFWMSQLDIVQQQTDSLQKRHDHWQQQADVLQKQNGHLQQQCNVLHQENEYFQQQSTVSQQEANVWKQRARILEQRLEST